MTRLAPKQLTPRRRPAPAPTRMAQRAARGLRGSAARGFASPVHGRRVLSRRSASAHGRLRRDRHRGSSSLRSCSPLLGDLLLFRARVLLQPGRKVCLRTVPGHATRFLIVVEPAVACAGWGSCSPVSVGGAASERCSGRVGKTGAASAAAPPALAQPQGGVRSERR